jgi:phage tail-like protein
LLRQLPKTLWREPRAAEFLGRYLMPEAAMLDEWGAASGMRHRLLDARIAPPEALEWLGGWLGLAMDGCWPESARRQMLLEASSLFRIRGTVEGLRRMVAILSGGEVTIVELFRLRSGGVAGNEQARISRGVLGGGYRVGGAIGAEGDVTLEAGAERPFEDYAHRFTVLVANQLDDAQLRCLKRLVEVHKPAHTMFELCAMHAGTRVGVGLHAGLGAAIGKGSGFAPVVISDAVLGKGYLLGRPPLDEASDAAGCWT